MLGFLMMLVFLPLSVYLFGIALSLFFHNLDRKMKDQSFFDRLTRDIGRLILISGGWRRQASCRNLILEPWLGIT